MVVMEKLYLIILLLGLIVNIIACSPDSNLPSELENGDGKENDISDNQNGNTGPTKIKITVDDTVIYATMAENATARDFISMLPLSLTLEDYAGTEKVSDLPRELSTDEVPSGYNPSVGDITYYAPWGNLAIFYKDFGYAAGLIHLGKIEGDMEPLTISGSIDVSIEKINKN